MLNKISDSDSSDSDYCIQLITILQDTRFFISGKLPIVHDYIQCLINC